MPRRKMVHELTYIDRKGETQYLLFQLAENRALDAIERPERDVLITLLRYVLARLEMVEVDGLERGGDVG